MSLFATAPATGPATRVAVVVGNPRPRSRTLESALLLVDHLTGAIPTVVLDLADHARDVADWSSSAVGGWVEEVRGADLVVVASPTYKATYTGLLKSFLDRFPDQGLRDQVAVALMLGGSPAHALAPEVALRPLLSELGAVVPAPGLHVLDHDHTDPPPYRAWSDRYGPFLRAALDARATISGVSA